MDFWKRVWTAKVPGKVKVHTWKACSAILPTISQLGTRRVFIDNGCCFCNGAFETIEHVSRDCGFVHAFLQRFPEFTPCCSQVDYHTSFMLWLVPCSETLSKDNFSFFIYVIWSIWKERNQRVWHERSLTLDQLLFQTRSQLQVFSSARFPPTTGRIRRVIRPWSPPPPGWLKANSDGALIRIH